MSKEGQVCSLMEVLFVLQLEQHKILGGTIEI